MVIADFWDEDMFRTHIGRCLIRIGKADNGLKKGYALWLIGNGGSIAAEAEFYPDEPGYEFIEDLYTSARLSTRGGEQLIDNIIDLLNPSRT